MHTHKRTYIHTYAHLAHACVAARCLVTVGVACCKPPPKQLNGDGWGAGRQGGASVVDTAKHGCVQLAACEPGPTLEGGGATPAAHGWCASAVRGHADACRGPPHALAVP